MNGDKAVGIAGLFLLGIVVIPIAALGIIAFIGMAS